MHKVDATNITILIMFGVLGFLGCIGNFFILLALFKNRIMRRVTHMLIINQALSDFSLCALSLPLRIVTICVRKSVFMSHVLASASFCRLSAGLNTTLFGASFSGLLLLTVDKFLAVNWPLRYRADVRKRHLAIPVALSWILPLAMGACGVLIPALQADLDDHSHDVACIHSSIFNKPYALCIYSLTLVLPLTTIFPMYFQIVVKVKNSWQFRGRAITNGASTGFANSRIFADENVHRKKEIRLTRGILILLGIHLGCLLPILVLDFIHIILQLPMPPLLDEVCLFLLYLNAVLDPPIYTRHSHDIKHTLRRLFCSLRNHDQMTQTARALHRRAKTNKLMPSNAVLNMSSSNQNTGFVRETSTAERTKNDKKMIGTNKSVGNEEICIK